MTNGDCRLANWLVNVACEQALWGSLAVGQEKEGGLATTSLEFEICIKKVDAKS